MRNFERWLMLAVVCVLPVSTTRASDYALFFDGANDFATFGPASALGLSNFTIEVRFKRLGVGQATSTGSGGTLAVPLITKGRSQADGSNLDMNYFLGITNNLLVADFENFASGANYPVRGNTAITNGGWYHAAATYDGNEWRLYLNGNLETNVVVGQTPRYDSIQHAGLATAMTSTGATNGAFRGYLREARIWNYKRDAADIIANVSVDITNAPGLVGRWGLDGNTGTTLTDTSGSGVTGILSNGPAWTDFASPTNLVFIGDAWRYFKGTSYPSGWETNGYNDSAWLTGPSGFGYGDFDDATLITDMTNSPSPYVTVFTRREFAVPTNASAVGTLILGADYDDGFVAFINGVEVARRSMPAGPISNTTTGLSHNAGTRTAIILTNDFAALLSPGNPSTNLIAVSVHNATTTSSDLTLVIDLAFSTNVITAVPVLVRSPYLQIGTHTNISVRWRTDIASNSRVRYGDSHTNLTVTIDDAAVVTEHEIKLTGLTPNTRYFYAIGTTAQTLAGADTNHFFQTAPVPGTPKTTRVWAVGDFGTGDASQINVFNAYLNYAGTNYTDAILMLGDNAYETGTDSDFTTKLFTPYAPLLRQTVSWPAVGNHDVNGITNASVANFYYQSFTMPAQGEAGGTASGTERYYSFDIANIHFICLDSQSQFKTYGPAMMTWLNNDLAATTQQWLIAYFHHPPYSKGSHNSDTEYQLIEMRTNALPILEAAGVDLVLCGHSHVYERSYLVDGHYGLAATFNPATMTKYGGSGRESETGAYMKPNATANAGAVYTVAGSGGKLSGNWVGGSSAVVNPTPAPVMFVSRRELGSVALEVTGDRLDAKFITSTGATNDSFTILKGAGVQITAPVPTAAEFGAVTGVFNFVRTGATNFPVTLGYSLGGTASNGLDYAALSSSLNLPAGATSTNLAVAPLPDNLAEGTETIQLNLLPNVAYTIGAAGNATVSLFDKPVDAWRVAKFTPAEIANPAFSGNAGDPDGDGVVNLMEYALGLEPKTSNGSGLPVPGMDTNGFLTLTYRRMNAAADLTYAAVATNAPAGPWSATGIVETQLSDDGTVTTIRARDAVPVAGEPQRFMRLQVTPTP